MLKRVEALQKFLKAVSRLAKNGDITIDEVYEFAKKEFGEVSDLMKLQINKIFKQSNAPSIKKPEPKGDVVPFKTSRDQDDFLQRVGKQVEQDRKDLGPIDTKEEGITFSVPEKGIFNQKTSIDEVTDMLTKNPFRRGGGLDLTTGMTRTAARVVLDRYGIKVPDKGDAIDVFEENFGGDALMDLKDVADELIEKEQMGRITESMGEFLESRGMFDLKVDKTARKGMSDKELLDKMEETEQEDVLKKFDPEDREPNAMGGLNRIGYKVGTALKLIPLLKSRGTTFAKAIKNAIDNFIQPSGDRKLDADVILDDMLEELNIDRDMVDQKDILDAYDKIYTTISKPSASELRVRNEMKEKYGFTDERLDEIKNTPIDEEMADKLIRETDLPENVDPRDTILPSTEFDVQEGLDDLDNLNLGSKKGDVVSKQLKIMRLAEDIQPGLFEKLTDKQLDIIVKYGDRIDQELLKNIVLDPDPSNQAAAVATLDEVQTMMDKGMSTDEIMNALQSTPRRKQAEGGLSYLMGM